MIEAETKNKRNHKTCKAMSGSNWSKNMIIRNWLLYLMSMIKVLKLVKANKKYIVASPSNMMSQSKIFYRVNVLLGSYYTSGPIIRTVLISGVL